MKATSSKVKAAPAASKTKAASDGSKAKAAPGIKPASATRDVTGEPWEIMQADFVAAAGPGSTLPEHGPEIAFAGRSNVGKSSLINTLTGRKSLVRVGATPGVTRTLTQFAVQTRAGSSFALVDLPGYGFAQRSKAERQQWAQLIERYLREREQLVAVVLLVDPRRGVEEDDQALVDFVSAPSVGARPVPELFVVATKIDKVPRSSSQAVLRSIAVPAGLPVIGWSSVTGQGKSELGRRIALALERAGSRR